MQVVNLVRCSTEDSFTLDQSDSLTHRPREVTRVGNVVREKYRFALRLERERMLVQLACRDALAARYHLQENFIEPHSLFQFCRRHNSLTSKCCCRWTCSFRIHPLT